MASHTAQKGEAAVMACCAFALFLVAQLLAPFRALARALGWSGTWVPDPAVEWRPGLVMDRTVRASKVKRGLGAVIAIDLLLFAALGSSGIGTNGAVAAQASGPDAVVHAYICGSDRKAS